MYIYIYVIVDTLPSAECSTPSPHHSLDLMPPPSTACGMGLLGSRNGRHATSERVAPS